MSALDLKIAGFNKASELLVEQELTKETTEQSKIE